MHAVFKTGCGRIRTCPPPRAMHDRTALRFDSANIPALMPWAQGISPIGRVGTGIVLMNILKQFLKEY